MPDPIQQYYEYLRKAGADVPNSFSSFKSTLSNETSAKQYFGYLKSNNFDAPETFESFANTLGLKKKDGIEGLETTAKPVGEPAAPTSPSQLPSVSEPLAKLKGADIKVVTPKAQSLGVDPLALSSAINDFEADDDFIINKAKEYNTNKAEYDKSKAAYRWRSLLKNSMTQKGLSDEDANFQIDYVTKLQQLDVDPNTGEPIKANFAGAFDRVNKIRQAITENVSDADDRAEALRALQVDSYAAIFQGMKDQNVVNNWAANGGGNMFIGAGLDALKLTDPEKAKSLEERIRNPYATEEDKQLYKKELEDLGLSAVAFEIDRNFNRVSQSGAKPSENFVNSLANWKNLVEKTKRSQMNRYGDVSSADIDKILFDVTEGLETPSAKKATYNVAVGATEWLERGLSGIWDYATKSRDERIAADMKRDHSKYMTEEILNYGDVGSSMREADYIPKVTNAETKKKIDDILANTELSRDKKYESVYPLIKSAYQEGQIEFFPNPNKGNINLTSKNVLHLLSTSGARSLGNIIPTVASGGALPAPIIAGLDATAMKYDEQFREGKNDPAGRAIRSGLTVGALSNIMDEGAALAKAFKGGNVTLATVRPTTITSAKKAIEMVGKEQAEELTTEAIDGDVVKNWKEVMLSTAIIAPIFAGPTAVIDNRRSSEFYRQLWFEAGTNPTLAKSGLKTMLDDGGINAKQYDQAVKRVDQISNIVANMPKVDMKGNPLSDSQKALYADNLMKKIEAKNVPDTLPSKMVDSINEAAKKADEENAIILEGAEPIAPEGVDRPAIISNTTAEVERVKALTPEQEDGATFDLSGQKYTGQGLVIPVVSENVTTEELTPERIADFLEANKGKIGDSTKVGIYKFPNSNNASIDLNIVVDPKFKEVGLQFGKLSGQESLFDLGTFENVKTGATGANPMTFTDEEFKEISKALSEGRMPNVFKKTAEERLGAEVTGDIDAKVASAQKALDATGVKINMIDNTADFETAVAERKGPAGVEGVFLSDTGEILINKELLAKGIADGRVIWHEASHPVINIVRNTNSQLFDQVVSGLKQAAADNKEISGVLQWANDNYGTEGEGVVNDEAVNELIANIAEGVVDIEKVPTGLKQAIIDLVNKIAQALGFSPVLSDTDVAAFKKLTSEVANALTTGRDISEIVGAENVAEIGVNLGDPVQLRKAEPKGEPVTVGADYKLSFVKESDLIDINGLIKDIQDKGQKVWFWVADQLGRGMYYDKVIDGEHYLDAGPSYALDPENRDKNIIWASGMPKARAEKLINDSDYIFIISGSPTKSKLFNKRVAELVINRIKNVVGEENTYAKFKKQVLKASKVSALNKLVGEFNSFEELIESPRRKDFLNMINDQKEKKGTDLKKLLDKYNAFVDYNELSDDFYRENGFEQNDIMLVLKPTSVGGKSAHSTYENDILGDVVGVPDRKINSYDIMPDEIRNEYGELPRAQQSQVVAPYGAGVRKVQARKGNLVAEAGLNKQMTSDDKGNYLFYHYSDRKLKTISPSKFGKNLATGRDERPGIGISMYYTRPDVLEAGVPSDYGFAVRVPENKVYPFNEDPLDLLPAAEKEFKKKFPGQAFDFNKQVAFVTQEAAKRGYPMTVAQWNIRGTKALRAQTTEEFKPEMYRELVPGTMNQYEYNPEIDKFKPNAKRRGQASVGKRDLDNRLKAFAQRERELGTSDQEIEQAIRNRFPLMDQARIDEIMAKPTVAQPTVEEKLETVVQPEGEEKNRGMGKRMLGLDDDTYSKLKDEAKTYFSQPNKQTEKAAEEFMKGKSLEYLAEFVTSNPNIPGAVNVWMAAMTAKQLGTEIDAAKKAGDVNKVEMLSAARANIYNYFSAKATELGQTIQAFVSFKNDPAANQFIFNKILKQLEEKGVTGLSEDQKTDIKKLLDDVSNAPAGLPKDLAITELSHYLAKLTPVNAFDIAQAIWYAKILSGITTQSKNFFANLMNTFLEVPIVGLRMSVQTGSLQPMFYAMKGLGGGSLKGLVKAGDILKSGVTSKSEDKFFNNDNLLEYFRWSDTKLGQTFGGLTGKILDFPLFFETSPRALKYVGRALTASDAVFSTANQEAMANMMAFAQAKEEGRTGINTYKRVQEILNNTKQAVADAKVQATSEGFKPGTVQHKRRVIEIVNQQRGEEIVAKAEDFGKRATLTNEPEGFTRGIYQVATNIQEKLPLSRVMIPFTRIVSNVSEMVINYSPAGMYRALTGIRNPKFSFKYTPSGDNKLTADERADLFIKSAIGLTALTVLAANVGDDDDDWFDITAGGPTDFAKKYELMKGGWRPYTITFKDGTKVNYAEWPTAGAFSAIGTLLDTERYGNVEDPEWVDKMVIGAYGYTTTIYDKSLLKGISDFIDIFRPSGKYGAGSEDFIKRTAENTLKFGAQQVKAVTMSNAAQQTLKLVDEYKDNPIKEAKGAEILYRDIPVINDGLNPIIDVFGDEVTYATSERLLPWMSVSDDKKDSIIAYLNRNNIFVGMAPEKSFIDLNTGEERKMTRDELYNYRKLAGQYSKEMLTEYLETIKDVKAMEKDLGKGLAKDVVGDIVSAARERAYAEIVIK